VTVEQDPVSLQLLDAHWRAANFLSAGHIFLCDNPPLKRPLTLADVEPMLLGHWGTTPGQNFIYAHLNRVIRTYDLDMNYDTGPGHGGPAVVDKTYLEGTYCEVYPDISRDKAGLKQLFRQFSFPGGIPSRASLECPGSIHVHVRGYQEEGTITTPFDMTVLDDLDRCHLEMDTIDHLPQTGAAGGALKGRLAARLDGHKRYVREHGQDMPKIRNWRWRPAP
jgi:phosphoketolase